MPMRFSSATTNSAARRTSPMCSGSVEIEGIRCRAFSSSTNRSRCFCANPTAAAVVSVVTCRSLLNAAFCVAYFKYRKHTPSESGMATGSAHPGIQAFRRNRLNEREMPMTTSQQDGTMIDKQAQFDLLKEISDSEKKKPWTSGHYARTLFKKHDFRIVLICM